MLRLQYTSRLRALLCGASLIVGLWSASPRAAEPAEQAIYLPIYSHVYFGDLDSAGKPAQKLLSAHVSIRNTDTRNAIRVLYARYYDTDGKLVKNYVLAPVTVPAMGTVELFVPRGDVSGGSGANFVIGWKAEAPVNPPLAQAIHAAIEMSRTLTFRTEGLPIQVR